MLSFCANIHRQYVMSFSEDFSSEKTVLSLVNSTSSSQIALHQDSTSTTGTIKGSPFSPVEGTIAAVSVKSTLNQATRQTVRVSSIRPSPLTRGRELSPSGSFSSIRHRKSLYKTRIEYGRHSFQVCMVLPNSCCALQYCARMADATLDQSSAIEGLVRISALKAASGASCSMTTARRTSSKPRSYSRICLIKALPQIPNTVASPSQCASARAM